MKKEIKNLINKNFPLNYCPKELAGKYRREKPRPYLELALDILNFLGGKVIVEIGSARRLLKHSIDQVIPDCAGCNGGHSTYVFSNRPEFELHSCDVIRYKHLVDLEENQAHVHLHTKDGVEFLREFDNQIDLLYLDGWDVGTPGYKRKSLEALYSGKDKLAKRHIILMDDTDLDNQGKGQLIIEEFESVYETIVSGRQTLLLSK